MKLRDVIYKLRLFGTFVLLAALLAACVDDDLYESPENSELDTSGFSLGITISLDDNFRTRVDNYIEDEFDDYIDTKNKFRLLFFDENGQFIFEAIDRTVMPRVANGKVEHFVHIPVNYIVDNANNVYDVEALKTQLKNHDFKVAVLANWPTRDPDWGLAQSIYGNDTKNINDLHHLVDDSSYGNSGNGNSSNNRPSSKETYGFLMDGNKMGVKSQWVESLNPEIKSRTDAETWIRSNWEPDKDDRANNKYNYRSYANLWYLWNFDGAYVGEANKDSDLYKAKSPNAEIRKQWAKKNHDELYKMLEYDNQNGWYITDYEYIDGAADFKFVRGSVANNERPYLIYNEGKGCYGVALPAGDKTKNVFKFKSFATGFIRIKYGSANNQTTQLIIERRNNENGGVQDSKKVDAASDADIHEYPWELSVTGDTQYISIYCTQGVAVVYEIEYMGDKYLYDTDRQGILPSESQPIPMYGVQNFGALTDWAPGSTFDLSNKREDNSNNANYDVKHISLIRAVSKVIVYLPEVDGHKPSHVYMRSINRTARCEPMDVEKPTNELWGSHQSGEGGCEWYTIQSFGSFFQGSGPKDDKGSDEKVTTYQKRLSWFYGSWQAAKWLNKGQSGWDFGTAADGTEIDPYNDWSDNRSFPHLFNTSIDRSDFTEMREVPNDQGGNYHKYILYVPDKNIDDPNYVGLSQSVTKVAHVEYRYDDMSDVNLDDNNCYRIYFTDYKSNPTIGSVSKKNFDNVYELNQTNLSYHWPIMRNHVYRFMVGDGGTLSRGEGSPEVISSEVMTWSGEPLLE